jgi:hypothetical protein
MNQYEVYLQAYALHRKRTIDLLDKCLREPDPLKVLGFRPGPGRAHIAWQLTHVGITEELFATERLSPPKKPGFGDLLPRFRGGSTPDDDIPSPDLIRKVLDESRKHLVETFAELHDGRLEEIPAALAERKLTIRDVFHILGWHEAHHHGQAHITFNIYKATGQ